MIKPTPNELRAMRAQAYPDILNDDGVEVGLAHNRELQAEVAELKAIIKEMGKFVLYVAGFPEKYMAIRDRDLPFEAQRLIESTEILKIMEAKDE